MAQDKALVVLPPNVNREEIMAALPPKFWDDGYQFQSYSPLSDATISIPFFKIWIDIKGVPLELFTEAHMATVVSSFGTYLGSMEPAVQGECQTWTVFLATDDLALIPYEIEIRVGGMITLAQIHPRKWSKGQVFHHSELPPAPVPYHAPVPVPKVASTPLPTSETNDQRSFLDDDMIRMSLTALREIFRNVPPADLPAELAACIGGDEQAIANNQAACRRWKREMEHRRSQQRVQAQLPTQPMATADQPQLHSMPVTSQLSPAHLHSSHEPDHSPLPAAVQPTVHRTTNSAARGKRTQEDLALQVCTLTQSRDERRLAIGWEPHILFPEICSPIIAQKTRGRKKRKGNANNKAEVTQLPRRSTRNKENRITTGEKGILNVEVDEFVDIPLQLSEGTELLTLIGSNNITIPSHLFTPIQQQQQSTNLDMAQSTKAQQKRTRQSGPPQQNESNGLDEMLINAAASPPMVQEPTVPDQGVGDLQASSSRPMQDGPNDAEDKVDDPYIDQVDYSGSDLDL